MPKDKRIGIKVSICVIGIILLYIFLPVVLPVVDASSQSSHQTHTLTDRGPKMVCRDCHTLLLRQVSLFGIMEILLDHGR